MRISDWSSDVCSSDLWSSADEPLGSHHSAAIFPKWAASLGSMVPTGSLACAMAPPYQAGPPDPKAFQARRMARIVMKFRGTSMAGIVPIRLFATHLNPDAEDGNQVAVVVSPQARRTDTP